MSAKTWRSPKQVFAFLGMSAKTYSNFQLGGT